MVAYSLEVFAALTLTRGDVDAAAKSAHASGTKNRYRDRVCYVMDAYWPYVERYLRTVVGDASRLFPILDRWRGWMPTTRCAAVAPELITNYRLHDARHTYAVTAIKHGASLERVAKQLGHGSTQMVVSTSGRYLPEAEETRTWERNFAAAREQAATVRVS